MHPRFGKVPYFARLHAALEQTAFERHPILFYAVVLGLLGFFALGIVHEAIPGLCTDHEEGDEDCPFCKLVHALTLVSLMLACVAVSFCCCVLAFGHPGACPLQPRYPHFLLRAPPVY